MFEVHRSSQKSQLRQWGSHMGNAFFLIENEMKVQALDFTLSIYSLLRKLAVSKAIAERLINAQSSLLTKLKTRMAICLCFQIGKSAVQV